MSVLSVCLCGHAVSVGYVEEWPDHFKAMEASHASFTPESRELFDDFLDGMYVAALTLPCHQYEKCEVGRTCEDRSKMQNAKCQMPNVNV